MHGWKRYWALGLTLLVLLSLLAVGAFAADTADSYFNFLVNPASDVFIKPNRFKTNDTPVYVKCTEGEPMSVRVAVYGCLYETGIPIKNCTRWDGQYVLYVICYKNVQQSIHSWVFENGYVYATLAFQANGAANAGTVGGAWSPDSTRVYTYASP